MMGAHHERNSMIDIFKKNDWLVMVDNTNVPWHTV